MRKTTVFLPLLSGFLLGAAVAGPVTTVPWNGHEGAVSFTYDDARESQIPNLIPQLDSLGLKATFFIAAANVGDFTERLDDWMQVSRDGHELANHTYNHVNVTDANAAASIKEMADYLRALDSTILSLTFAYPNCNLPGTAGKDGVSAENFIARGCGNTSYAWGTQPTDWMDVRGLILQPNNVNTAINLINTAQSQNRWAVMIVHDVTPSPDQYSVTPESNLQMLQAALDADLWIDTYMNVGAYYRAHFVMDTVQGTPDENGMRLTWESPHSRMPPRVMLRVNIDKGALGDSAVVAQGRTVIHPEPDGSYIIDFMKRTLDVLPAGTVAVAPGYAIDRAGSWPVMHAHSGGPARWARGARIYTPEGKTARPGADGSLPPGIYLAYPTPGAVR